MDWNFEATLVRGTRNRERLGGDSHLASVRRLEPVAHAFSIARSRFLTVLLHASLSWQRGDPTAGDKSIYPYIGMYEVSSDLCSALHEIRIPDFPNPLDLLLGI